ncbi:MAG: sensor histidine kinase [Paracoccaceae bacterium]
MKEPLRPPDIESSEARPRLRLGLHSVWLRPLPVVLTLVTISLMVILAQHIIERFRATQLASQSHLAEVYISRFLAPYALDLSRGGDLDTTRFAETVGQIDPRQRKGGRMAMHIWGIDGGLLFSSTPSADIAKHDDADLKLAISGQNVEKIEEDPTADDGAPLPPPYLEIYMPIWDPDGGRIIAVGEIYFDATAIMADIGSFEWTVISATGLTTIAFLVMLAASARQSEQLRERLEAERRLAIQNERLRNAAEQARQDASRANEETLNLVGAELHDGPVQLLTLASLMPSATAVRPSAPGPSQSALIRQAVDQLRELSSGLILPEIEVLDLNEVVALAARRYQALSAIPLHVSFPKTDVQLDLPRRICIYRVIQEGLTNAGRHGDGGEVKLTVEVRASVIGITIVSTQAGSVLPEGKGPTHQLGLQAMRRRLATFGGTAVLRDIGNTTALQVALPVSPDESGVEEPDRRSPGA